MRRAISVFQWLLTHCLLFRPARVNSRLDGLVHQGVLLAVPNLWQVTLGILRMWHRMLTRSDSIGLCVEHSVRPGWRARWFRYRPLRFPFLLLEGSVIPWDLSGLASSSEQVITHLLGTHHEGSQFVYDLELLSGEESSLQDLRARAALVVDRDDRRSRWLRDLVVFERYHETLLARVDEVLAQGLMLRPDEESDPDLSLRAHLRWCANQPETAYDTWRAWRSGSFTLALPEVV